MNQKVIIFILTFALALTFITLPQQKAQASGIAIGTLFGLDLGYKILLFIYASAAAGATYHTVQQAKSAYDRWIERTGVSPGDNLPPSEPGGSNNHTWKDAFQGLLAGNILIDSIGDLVTNIKEWFQSLGSKVGENNIGDELPSIVIDGKIFPLTLDNNGKDEWYGINNSFQFTKPTSFTTGMKWDIGKAPAVTSFTYVLGTPSLTNGKANVKITAMLNNTWRSVGIYEIPSLDITSSSIEQEVINYTVNPGSLITDEIPPLKTPQPNVSGLPFNERVNSDGQIQQVYDGNFDDLANYLVENQSFDDIMESINNPTPYTLTETESGLVINYDQDTGQIIAPYPDTTTETPVDTLTGIGSIISLIKGLINWISQIPNLIGNMISSLFVPSENFFGDKIIDLKNTLENKIGSPNPSAVTTPFSGISCLPIPDGFYKGIKFVDASYINSLAPMLIEWQRWFWYILIGLMGLNNTYKLIRGTNLIDGKNYDGGRH